MYDDDDLPIIYLFVSAEFPYKLRFIKSMKLCLCNLENLCYTLFIRKYILSIYHGLFLPLDNIQPKSESIAHIIGCILEN